MATQRKTPQTVIASALIGMIIAALVLWLSFAAAEWTPDSAGVADAGTSAPAGVSYVQVTDSLGRVVDVPENPLHIAALDAFSGNVCVLAGAGERLMGAPGGVLSNELLKEICPDLESKAQLSGSTVNAETLLQAGVDVALVRRTLYEGGGEADKLDRVGIPYVVVDYGTVEEQMQAIRLVGDVCGADASQRAQQITDCYQEVLDLVSSRTSQLSEEDRVRVYHSINDPLLTDGLGSLGADWISICGATDVSAGEESTGGQTDYTATLEQIYSWSPDVIICNTAAGAQVIRDDARWGGLKAVESGNVYNMPVSTSRWGQRGDPEVFLGMLWLGKTVYPSLYEDIDLQEYVTDYYRDIVGLEIDDALWEIILSGEGLRIEGNGQNGGGE